MKTKPKKKHKPRYTPTPDEIKKQCDEIFKKRLEKMRD